MEKSQTEVRFHHCLKALLFWLLKTNFKITGSHTGCLGLQIWKVYASTRLVSGSLESEWRAIQLFIHSIIHATHATEDLLCARFCSRQWTKQKSLPYRAYIPAPGYFFSCLALPNLRSTSISTTSFDPHINTRWVGLVRLPTFTGKKISPGKSVICQIAGGQLVPKLTVTPKNSSFIWFLKNIS